MSNLTKSEAALCLGLILADIRGSWGDSLEDRLEEANDLAEQVGSQPHQNAIKEFYKEMAEGDADGRFFRCDWSLGGYEGHEAVHGIDPDYNTVSEAVRSFVECNLNYPEYSLLNHPEG